MKELLISKAEDGDDVTMETVEAINAAYRVGSMIKPGPVDSKLCEILFRCDKKMDRPVNPLQA